MNPDLTEAFRHTRYCVNLDDPWLTLRIDAPCPEQLSRWVEIHNGQRPAWLITAWNPSAQASSESDNAARSAWLAAHLDRSGFATLAAVNRAENGDWPDEPGFLIAGMEEGRVRALGRRLDQLALICVKANAPVRLLWLAAGQASE